MSEQTVQATIAAHIEDALAEYAAESLEMSRTFEHDSPVLHPLERVAEEYGISLDELRSEMTSEEQGRI